MAASTIFDWIKVKKDFLKDETVTLETLAQKYGINYSYLRYIAAKEKWREEREKVQQLANNRLTQKLPETIANIKARQARYGKVLQTTAMRALVGNEQEGIKPITPESFDQITRALNIGISIERKALQMDDKQIHDEIYTKFQQFSFIFNLTKEELQRFIQSALEYANRSTNTPVPSPSAIQG